MWRRAAVTFGVMAALAAGCAPVASFTPGTPEHPRTVLVSAFDPYAFGPDRITVRAGETVRFVVTNEGQVEHEFMVGSRQEMVDHAMSATHGGHLVDSAFEVRLLPGQTKELIYTFGSSTDIGYGCFIGDHYPKGMAGSFDVVP